MTTQKLTSDDLTDRQLSDAALNKVNGGFCVSILSADVCYNTTDGLSVGGGTKGPSAGAQVYDATMRGVMKGLGGKA